MRTTLLTLTLLVGGCTAWAGTICPTSSGLHSFFHNPDNGATGCNVVITITNSGASVSVKDATPYDPTPNPEDSLIGVVNNSSSPVSSLQLTGTNLFNFDQDGICNFVFVGDAYCLTNVPGGTSSTGTILGGGNTSNGVDPYDYQGPTSSFSNTSSSGGTVNFNPALGVGASTYFSLEGVPSVLLQAGPPTTPIPNSILLALVGFAILLAFFYLGNRLAFKR